MPNSTFETFFLKVPKEHVNRFLSLLWDEFSKNIGPVSCQHHYTNTDNSEVYRYNVCWSSNKLPFMAELSFLNHTAKGLLLVNFDTVDYETRIHSSEYHDKIKTCLVNCLNERQWELNPEPTGYLSVPIKSRLNLSGSYFLEASRIFIRSTPESCGFEIIFPVFNNAPNELAYEGNLVSENIISALSVLTQNAYHIDYSSQRKLINVHMFQKMVNSNSHNGKYIQDDGHIFHINFMSEDGVLMLVDDPALTKEIITKDDCVANEVIHFPERTDILINQISNDYRLQQSCLRFHEGLMLREEVFKNNAKLHQVSYELIAYVAAIEACLDTEPEKIEILCSRCGTPAYKEERKISAKFMSFIERNCDKAPLLLKAFKDLYNDRSMFVHTGISLHAEGSVRPHRPLILKGKHFKSDLPKYWHNIHDFTGLVLRNNLYKSLFSELNLRKD